MNSCNNEYKVYFRGGFYGKQKWERAGEEIPVNKTFTWGEDTWLIPAVYSCSAGLVMDMCMRIEAKRMADYIQKLEPYREQEELLTDEIQDKLQCANPLHQDFDVRLQINGKEVLERTGYGESWIPEACLPEGESNSSKAKAFLEHYDLDLTCAWVIRRMSFPWPSRRRMEIHELDLMLIQHKTDFSGIHFTAPAIGESLTFTHPLTGAWHTLTVQALENSELDTTHFGQEDMIYPNHYIQMEFTVEPNLTRSELSVRDCSGSDQPRKKVTEEGFGPHATSSIGIIGGADGPTAILLAGKSSGPERHLAISSLHFEPAQAVEWRMIFHKKMKEDIRIKIQL